MIGIPIGLAVANAGEWAFHKYVLHGLGKNKDSFWSFHWHEHHRNVRRLEHRDPAYDQLIPTRWNGAAKELAALSVGSLALIPLFPVAPFFATTLAYSVVNYYRKHRRAHKDPQWAREHLPWHYDHHMGPNQHRNWCVTRPWFDRVMGTRDPYVGSERDARDRGRARQKSEARVSDPPQNVAAASA